MAFIGTGEGGETTSWYTSAAQLELRKGSPFSMFWSCVSCELKGITVFNLLVLCVCHAPLFPRKALVAIAQGVSGICGGVLAMWWSWFIHEEASAASSFIDVSGRTAFPFLG
eukprot:3978915-Amphidinium_carterae.1